MTDKKDKEGKVLIGPWGEPTTKNSNEAKKWVKEKYDRALEKKNIQLKMKEKLARVDMITENVMIQLIHTLGEYDYEIGKDDFILDIGFLSETVKAVISRQERIPHVVQGLVDSLMTPEKGKDEKGENIHYSRFNSPLLNELVGMANEIRETPNDVIFEPDMELDTDPEEISGWKVDIDKEDKDKDKDDDNGGKEF